MHIKQEILIKRLLLTQNEIENNRLVDLLFLVMSGKEKISLMMIDDHQIFSEGLAALFEKDSQFVLKEFSNKTKFSIKEVENLLPDILILDYQMPDENGFDIAKKVLEANFKTKIVILSMHDRKSLIEASSNIGCDGFLNKGSSYEEIKRDLLKIHKGDKVFGGGSENVAHDLKSMKFSSLTKREHQVMMMLVQGWPNKMIASDLHLSVKTIEFHRKNLMLKLGVNSLVELTHISIEAGLVNSSKV